MRKVLIISDSIPGHFNQSIGVCELLSESIDIEYSIVEMRWRIHSLRSFFKIIGRNLCKNLTKFKSKLILSFFEEINLEDIDLLVAAGGNTFPINAALSLTHKVPNIQLGSPRGISSELFNVHITSEKYSDLKNNIVYDITPNKYSPSNYPQHNISSEKILFLFGGKGIGYSYSKKDIKEIAISINKITNKSKKEIFCVTKLRTYKNHE